jgi:nucleoside 2-deoxyribosyltransferase
MNNSNTIYICTKLFNYNDKLQAEYFEDALKRHIKCNIFMPFRDTKENDLVGPDRSKIIYDSDIKKLDSGEVILLAALYDGICKDEGISFEIGYAYGRKIPIFVINTDFIWYAIDNEEFIFDPVISCLCSDYVHMYKIDKSKSFKTALFDYQN